ncbi:unnamed protein product [Adineta steineri]|uniref:Uncharacterized protein n=1 Tax=Adineta steineri TaxID=433720 RepID=A0A814SRT7_9BILA|nr:unnamed protein product [Adineta steineri]CAF4009570.1 unnamed protein product [Adineta steineri]
MSSDSISLTTCSSNDQQNSASGLDSITDLTERNGIIDGSDEDDQLKESIAKLKSKRRSSIGKVIIFAIYINIAMISAILIVYYTTPKPINTCQLAFRRVMKSTLIYSSQPRSIAVADLNNDHHMDIVVANSGTNTIGVFISNNNNNSNETFSIQQTYSTEPQTRPYSIVIADFNNDIYLDIAVANFGTNSISIFIGNINSTYNSQRVFSTHSFRPWFISVGDFNNDHYSDLAVVFYGTDNIGIYLGIGNGSFQNAIIYLTGYDSLPYSLAISDFNNDNQLDIVVANYGTNNIEIFFGCGNGTFVNQTIYTTTHQSNPASISVGDFNGDQLLDIVVANHGQGNIGIFLCHSNGTFGMQTTWNIDSKSRPQFVSVGYITNDTYLDVVVVDSENDRIYIIPGNGDGSFATISTFDLISGSQPSMIAVVDFDHDNQSDIIVVNHGTNNVLLLSEYSSTPSARQNSYLVGHGSLSSTVAVYDFNNDGYLDIAVNNFFNSYILILNGIGNDSFVRGKTYSTGENSVPNALFLVDLNNDQRIDILVANMGSDCIGILFGQHNGTFANIITYSTGTSSAPWFAGFGDFNNDTYLDIVSANTGIGSITIFLGSGNGSFTNYITYSIGTGSAPVSLVVEDANNDYQLDILVANQYSNLVTVFLGYGNGTFYMITNSSNNAADECIMIAAGDFNRDNNIDAVIVNAASGNMYVSFGNGDGHFQEPVIYSLESGASPYYVAVTDYNGDNKTDIIATNFGVSNVLVFFGDGNGNFELARTFSTDLGTNPDGITFADFNNDGKVEIIVTYWGTGYVTILTEYYAAQFTNQISYSTGSAPHPYSLAVGHFNNNQQSDVVIANSDTDNLGILLDWHNGTFARQIIYPFSIDSYPQYVITGDVNKDNHTDIIAVNSESNTMSIILGYGNESFANQMIYDLRDDAHPFSVAMSDFNNDGRYDFVTANQGTDSISVFLGYDYTTFQNQVTYSDGNSSGSFDIVVADFNHDKYLDLAVSFQNSDTLTIFLGDGNGSFIVENIYSTGLNSIPAVLIVNDFNNDNHLDIVVANSGTNNIGVFLGYGNGSLGPMVIYSTGDDSAPYAVAAGDFNNDNQTDLVSANFGTNTIGILFGFGNGSFILVVQFSTGSFSLPNAVTVGDLNNDNRLDIVVSNYGTNTVGIFLGYGDGNFTMIVTYSTGLQSWPYWVSLGDFNGDNALDIAVPTFDNEYVSVFMNYGNGSFSDATFYSSGPGAGPSCASIGDFNNDNILDIAVANNGINNVVVLFGFGDGTFLLGRAYSTGSGSIPRAIAVGDFNIDGQLDIVVTNFQLSTFGIFLGDGREPYASAINYATNDESQPHSVAVGDFNNDGWMDIVVTNYGTDNIGIFLGSRSAIFGSMVTYSTGINSAPYSVVVNDFNNDNYSDIVVTNSETDNVGIFCGYGNGSFTSMRIYSTGTRSRPYTIVTGDLNNDKQLDLVIANSGTNNIFVLYGYGNATFGYSSIYPLGYGYLPYSIALSDMNNDNLLDIVIACYGTNHVEALVKMC